MHASALPRSDFELIVLTEAFPYGNRTDFLEDEIEYLASGFASVRLAPAAVAGVSRGLPKGVFVDLSLAHAFAEIRQFVAPALATHMPLFIRELTTGGKLRVSSYVLARAHATSTWLRRVVGERRRAIAYSYWFGAQSLGAIFASHTCKGLSAVTRAHGWDLFEERSNGRIPYRPYAIANIRRVFAVSNSGLQYLQQRYPMSADRCSVARLGTVDYGIAPQPNSSDTWVLVTCSSLSEVKRVELFAQVLIEMQRICPDRRIEWHHFGDGPTRKHVEALAGKIVPPWRAILHGQVTTSSVMKFFQTTPVDALINVSTSEGVPVSIMEAQSFGIPTFATAVGGTPECVNSENGMLIDPDTSPQVIAQELVRFLRTAAAKRMRSRQDWESAYVAAVNYADFVRAIQRESIP
jgi:colanic acid/amylovoran biosynthesis glycosyltransferase